MRNLLGPSTDELGERAPMPAAASTRNPAIAPPSYHYQSLPGRPPVTLLASTTTTSNLAMPPHHRDVRPGPRVYKEEPAPAPGDAVVSQPSKFKHTHPSRTCLLFSTLPVVWGRKLHFTYLILSLNIASRLQTSPSTSTASSSCASSL